MQLYCNDLTIETRVSNSLIFPAKIMVKIHPDQALIPRVSVAREDKASPFLTTEKESFTIWMSSLVFHTKGCTVFYSKGNLIYRVDNYSSNSCSEVYLMDLYGEVLFTLRQKVIKLYYTTLYNYTRNKFFFFFF